MLKKLAKVSQKLSPGLKKILQSIGLLYAEKVLTMALSLFVGIYVVKYLGSEKYGQYSFCASFVGLFFALPKLGLDGVVVRNILQKEEETREILGTAFVLKLLSSLFTLGLITFIIIRVNPDEQIWQMTIIIGLGLIFESVEVIDFWFQSKVLSGSIAIVRSCQFFLSSIVKIFFIFFKFPVLAFACLVTVDYLLRSIGMIWIYWQQKQSIFSWQISRYQIINLLRDSLPVILANVMSTIYMKIDQVMLGQMVNNQEVGYYAAAVRFSEIWYFVPVAMCSSVFPAILRAKGRSKQQYQELLQQLYDLMAWLALAIAIVMTYCSAGIIQTLLGAEYRESAQILALHIWAGPFIFLAVARDQWLMAENLNKFNFAAGFLGAISNVILNYFLIPIYGGLGAALATLISYAIMSHFSCLIYPPLLRNGWMLTKALFIPLRWQQNILYLNKIKKNFF